MKVGVILCGTGLHCDHSDALPHLHHLHPLSSYQEPNCSALTSSSFLFYYYYYYFFL